MSSESAPHRRLKTFQPLTSGYKDSDKDRAQQPVFKRSGTVTMVVPDEIRISLPSESSSCSRTSILSTSMLSCLTWCVCILSVLSKSNSSSLFIGRHTYRFHRRCRGCVGKGRKGYRAGPGLRDRRHPWQACCRQPHAVQASNQAPRDGRRGPKVRGEHPFLC